MGNDGYEVPKVKIINLAGLVNVLWWPEYKMTKKKKKKKKSDI